MRALFAACALAMTFSRAAEAQPKQEQARAVYAKGKAAYERGEYREALAQFESAYRLRPAPALLFNMAQAHRLSGTDHCQQALDLYRKYLAEDPNATNREEARERIDEMQACVAREQDAQDPSPAVSKVEPADSRATDQPSVERAPPEPPTAPIPVPNQVERSPSPRRTRPTAAIVVTGVGAALGVAGVIMYARARAKYDEVERTCPCPAGAFSNWETLTSMSYGLMAVGAAGTAGGISWYLLGGENGGSAPHGAVIHGVVRF